MDATHTRHPDQVDVADLVLAARGDRAALGRLYDRHAGLLLALGVRLLGDRREAEDVLHDCFVEAWSHAGDYDPRRASVRAWLALRMRSRCLDRLRSAHARHTAMAEDSTADNGVDPRVPSDGPETWDPAPRVDAMRLAAPIDALPAEQREILAHLYGEGLSASEVAAALGIPIGTVKSRARAAIDKLRASLGGAR